MKRTLVLAVAALLLVPCSIYAAGVSGITTHGKGNYGAGIEFEWAFERDLKLDKMDLGLTTKDVQAKDHFNIPLKLSYGLADNVDIYAKFGFSDFDNKGNLPALGNFEADSDWGMSYAVGSKGTFKAQSGLIYGADIQYAWSTNDNNISIAGGALTDKGEVKSEVWHIAPYIGTQVQEMLFYAGLRYGEARYEHDFKNLGNIDFESDENWGIFVGMDFAAVEATTITAELRLLDETAITIAATKKF